MTGDIIWQAPPAKTVVRRKGGVRAQFIEALKARPGEWAIYGGPQYASVGTELKRAYPGVDACSRKRPDGKFDVYARWIGEAS